MTVGRYLWILVVLILPRISVRGDAVLCTFMENCILPCTFQPGNNVLIHWIKQTDIGVHSYYRDKDQLASQNMQFSGRTKLFKDQFQKGNASLRLTKVELLDRGRYKCYTSTVAGNKDSAIDLNVEAPPRDVIIKQEENVITCSSEGLFPQPMLTWTSSLQVTLTPASTTFNRTQQELYSISSSLVVSESDVDYSCTVTTGRNSKTTTLHKPSKTEHITCNFDESCVLPCSFETGDNLFIRWKVNSTEFISYRNGQIDVKEQRFRGRVSLKEISKGDASLQLDPLEVQDEGRYECFISISTFSTTTNVELSVNALPRRVNIQREGNEICCSAEGIYPQPNLTWSCSSSSALHVTEEPKVLQTEQRLYNISSVVEWVDESVDYICTVSTPTNKRRATLFSPTSLTGLSNETKIPCTQNASLASQTGLTWRFNHRQIILIQTTADTDRSYPEKWWEKHVKNTPETRNLILENLSSDHDGVYTCEFSTAEEDYIKNTHLKVITGSSHNVGAIVLAVILLIAVIGLGVYLWKKQRNNPQQAPNGTTYRAGVVQAQ